MTIEGEEEEKNMEIEYDMGESRRVLMWITVMAVAVSVVVACFDMKHLILSIGAWVVVVAIAYISEGTKRDRRVKIDEGGIETTEWKAEWDEVEQCYIEYLGRGGDVAALTVEARHGEKKQYALHRMKYDRLELARQIDKMAGRQVFGTLKSAEARAGRVALVAPANVIGVTVVVALLMDNMVIVVPGIVVGVIAYFVVKAVVRKREMERYEMEGM